MRHDTDDFIPEIDLELDDRPAGRTRPARTKRANRKKLLIIAGCIAILLCAAAAGAYVLLVRNEDGTPAEDKTKDTSESEEKAPELSPTEAAQLVTFKSENLQLEFTYRRDWAVEESRDNNEIVITSPEVKYQTVGEEAEEKRGVFTLKIRKGVPQAMRDTINNTIALRKSTLVAYTKPTEVQRYYTNISFAGLEEAFTLFIVTGSEEYNTDDPLASTLQLSDPTYYLIAGGFGTDPENTLKFEKASAAQIDSQTVRQATAIVKSLRLF